MRAGVSGFQPTRLTQARQALGLTQVALSILVNCATSTISKWEKGAQSPEPDKLKLLSETLKMPEAWFLRPTPDYGNQPYFFRSNATATKTARTIAQIHLDRLQEISLILQQWIEWPLVNLPTIGEKNFHCITDEEIESLAIECRRFWNLGFGPVVDLMLAMENAGIICARDEIGFIKMDGVSHWGNQDMRPYVFLVTDKANGIRHRFDAAHELGHLILHRLVSVEEFRHYHSVIENQAHLFAGAFLMPAETFATEVSWPTLDTFLVLKRRWKVSVGAMIKRCEQLGIVDEAYATRLWKGRLARGWIKGEPYDDEFPFESLRLMPRAIRMIVDQKVFSKDMVLEALGLSALVCERLCELPKGYFKDTPVEDNVLAIKIKAGTGTQKPALASIVPFPGRHS